MRPFYSQGSQSLQRHQMNRNLVTVPETHTCLFFNAEQLYRTSQDGVKAELFQNSEHVLQVYDN